MLNRIYQENLQKWEKSPNRKPLILRGARQVGKTTLVRIFSSNFEQFIHLNLETAADKVLFEKNLSVKDIYDALLIRQNFSANKKTLVFIDEIQCCPAAISILRYFYEDIPQLHVIAAGSLLEIVLKKEALSFPVGRVSYLNIYPLTFYEYLQATGNSRLIEAFSSVPAPPHTTPLLFEHFHRYTLLGGMPEVVFQYSQTKDITSCNDIYQSLLVSYIDDISKYAKNRQEALIIRHCLERAPYDAATRIKFANFGNSNFKSKDVGNALRILERAMLIKLVYPSTSVSVPALPDFKKHPKIQFLDTGLVNYFVGLQQYYFEVNNLHGIYKGKIAEHIVLQELISKASNSLYKPCFWVRESKNSNAELDALYIYEDKLIPIEVKSGATGKLKSLHLFMDSTRGDLAIRFSAATFAKEPVLLPSGKKYTLLTIPYFHVSKIHQYLLNFYV